MTIRFFKSSFLLVFVLVLLGCGAKNETETPSAKQDIVQLNPAARVQALVAVEPSVQFNFSAKQQQNETLVELWLENPDQKSIHSAEAWLAFNPEKVEIKNIQYSSAFPLPAPYTDPVDFKQGILRLGAATMADASEKRILFATFSLTKEPGVAFFDLFDSTKRASVNTVLNGQTYNLLQKPDSPALVLP